MPAAMTLISSQTLASAVSTVTFGSGGTLTQGYRDLYLVMQYKLTSASTYYLQINGDTGSNYSNVSMSSANGTTNSNASTGTSIPGVFYNTLAVGDTGITTTSFLDYSATDKHKTVLIHANHPGENVACAGRWASTSAITSFTLNTGSTFVAGSVFYLYGVLA